MLTAAIYEARRQAIGAALIERRAAYDALALEQLDAGETRALRAIADEIQALQRDDARLTAAWRATQAQQESALDAAKLAQRAETLDGARRRIARHVELAGRLSDHTREMETILDEMRLNEGAVRQHLAYGLRPADAMDLLSGSRLLDADDVDAALLDVGRVFRLGPKGARRVVDLLARVQARATGALRALERRLAPPVPESTDSSGTASATTPAPEEVTA